jgi:hypothetical protein
VCGVTDEEGICAGSEPPIVNGRLTGSGLTLDEAALALEQGQTPALTDVQRRMVEQHALERADG